MKKIIDACLGEIGADPKTEADSIKLRLRGKGSGYKEGLISWSRMSPCICVLAVGIRLPMARLVSL